MINPGHGGHDSDDRHILPTDFWESEGNLYKGLFLRDLLQNSGCTIIMSRTTNTTADDLPLSQISQIANENSVDFFHSIHSNATGNVNYPLVLFHGYDNEPTYPESKVYGTTLWNTLYSNKLTAWTFNNPNIRGDFNFYGNTSGLGVLRILTMPGVLSEGSFHDYIPESFRLTNTDYCHLEAYNIFRAFIQYYQKELSSPGIIAGTVKDMNRTVEYWYAPASNDQYLPLNGAKVTLMPAAIEYVTDGKNNGFFFFDSLPPGDYQLIIEADKYFTDTVDVQVTAGSVNYLKHILEPDHTMPPVVLSWLPAGTDSVNATSPVEIRFNMSMDTLLTATAFSIEPPVAGAFYWTEEAKLLKFVPYETYQKQTLYTITIDTTAAHAWGVNLNEPLAFSFITKNRNRLLLEDSYPKENLSDVSPNLQFKLVFDAAPDQASLIGNVMILDGDGVSIATKSGKITSVNGKGIYTFLPKTALAYGSAFHLKINGSIKDTDGNPLVDTLLIPFSMTDSESGYDSLADGFDLNGSWIINPDSSLGYSAGSTSLAAYLVKMQGSNSHKLNYTFSTIPARIFMSGPERTLDSATTNLAIWIFGDLSYNTLALQVEDCSGNTLQLVVDTLDFAGWALKSFHLPENLKGCYCKISGMELIRNTGGAKTGEIYLDALTFGIESGDSGLDSGVGSSFRIYPNPAGNRVTVLLPDESNSGYAVQLLDLAGRVMRIHTTYNAGNSVTLDISDISSGVYLVRVRRGMNGSAQTLVILK
jgi:N-acetylmuramoyl-L-alanine amidase